ncbi:MAG: hypothetical protein WCL06_03145 [Bacteroidota bacterium]
MRHSEAIDADANITDPQRKLTSQGIADTQKVMQYLLSHEIIFDCIINSQAMRSVETSKIIAAGMNLEENKIHSDVKLYLKDAASFFDILFELDDSLSEVALVGHNPHITGFANYFLEEKISSMAPSTMVCVEINTNSWSDINLADCRKIFMITP